MLHRLLFFLKVSRPGLWFQTLWIYLLPTSATSAWLSPPFWLGLVYVTFPLNFLMYGWNDIVDRETDRYNPRKDSFVWGARGSRPELESLPLPMALAQLPFFAVFIYWGGWPTAAVLAALVGANLLYNLPRAGWRRKPPLELINILAILLILPLSTQLNRLPSLSAAALIYLAFFCLQAHLIGEIMDLDPDRRAHRRTTALLIGPTWSRLAVLCMVALEALLLLFYFREWVLAGFMCLCFVWLLFDLLVLAKRGPYSIFQYKLLALALNASGYLSLAWIWFHGGLSATA